MRPLLAVVLSAVLAIGVAAAVPEGPRETVPLPPPGSFVGAVTSQGTPVWIGHRRDDGTAVAGDVWVVDATTPDGDALTTRCSTTSELVDARTGDRFDLRGRSLDAASDTGLTPLRHEVDGAILVVVERLPAYPTLPFGGADTAQGRTCLGPGGDELEQHPAARG